MQLIAISTILASLSLGALGAALPEAANLQARANGGVFMCTDVNFTGQCIHLVNPFGNCVNLDSTYNDKVSAVGPDSGSLCTFSKDYGCSGAAYTLGSPGDSNLSDGDGSFNDAISSYFCKAG